MAEEEIENICNMGGAVSGGKSNDELVDNLIENNFIRSRQVQRAFRAVDRGNYYQPGHREDAYKDVAWRMGNLHVSAPCIYGVVMEALKLEPGLSFLNLGSGSGYLSTMAGLILGCYGINHGIELHKDVVDFAEERLDYFLKHSRAVDELDFCEPAFTWGNLLRLADTQQYDRVYCSVTVPEEYECYIKSFVKINGILVIPLKDKLLKLTRTSETEWQSGKLLNVHFASIILPPAVQKGELIEHVKLDDIAPPRLEVISRFYIRSILRHKIYRENPALLRKKREDEKSGMRPILCFTISPNNDDEDHFERFKNTFGLNSKEKVDDRPAIIKHCIPLVKAKNESDVSINSLPSQSTRDENKSLKRKESSLEFVPSTSSNNGTNAQKRKCPQTFLLSSSDDFEHSVELDEKKKLENDSSLTWYLTCKMHQLPLVPKVLNYLNYKRKNFPP